jgi:hypothetical protein
VHAVYIVVGTGTAESSAEAVFDQVAVDPHETSLGHFGPAESLEFGIWSPRGAVDQGEVWIPLMGGVCYGRSDEWSQ